MKSIQQLRVLNQNPFYTMTEQEKQLLEEANSTETTLYHLDDSKKKSQSLGSAAVKETGSLDKHSSDPIRQ